MRSIAIACLAATVVALRLADKAHHASFQRTRKLVAQQNGWYTAVDEASGATYYYNTHTGDSQWHPPEQQFHAAPLIWRVLPHAGVRFDYVGCTLEMPLHDGDEQSLGRFDMADPLLYVSRRQCVIHIEDGSATLISVGKPPTLWRAHEYAPWILLRRARPLGDDIGFDPTHELQPGEQISLDMRNPDGAVFTVTCEEAGISDLMLQEGGLGELQQQWSNQDSGYY